MESNFNDIELEDQELRIEILNGSPVPKSADVSHSFEDNDSGSVSIR